MKNSDANKRILLVGIGNTGRGDDGLGWKFVDAIENYGYANLDCEYRYQLQIEDAELISNYDVVVFVDACYDTYVKTFKLERCIADDQVSYSTHAQLPEVVVHLAYTFYNKFPDAYVLLIAGKEWGLQISLSTQAENHLSQALTFFNEKFQSALSLEPA